MKRTILPMLAIAMLLAGGCVQTPMTRFDYRNVKLDVGARVVRGEKVASVDVVPGVYYLLDRPIPQVIIEARIVEADRGQQFRELGIFRPDMQTPLLPVNVVDTTPRSTPMNVNFGVGTTLGGGRGRDDRNDDRQRSDSGGGIGVGTGASVPVGGNGPKGVTSVRAIFDLPELRVNLDGAYVYIQLEIGRELSGRVIAQPLLLPIQTVADPQAPELKEKSPATTVRIRDDDSIVLGGLVTDSEAEVKAKVPLLGDIPLLGRMFRKTNDKARSTELLIFLTPRIVVVDE